MDSYTKDIVKWVMATGLAVVLIAWGVVAFVSYTEQRECDSINESGTPAEYRGIMSAGCFVEVNGKFIPRENWRGEYQK